MTLDNNIISIPEPATLWLTALLGITFFLFRPFKKR
ncbi:MAG: PEP-CTERM sorting domain-containing protein [Kiritimatiellae bacterium]|nr:PEP-CTERM sorting domain-containing protein [Kiritimatiellia bacterium]